MRPVAFARRSGCYGRGRISKAKNPLHSADSLIIAGGFGWPVEYANIGGFFYLGCKKIKNYFRVYVGYLQKGTPPIL